MMYFYKVRDRHNCYYRILPFTSLPKDTSYLRRIGTTLYTNNFILGRLALYVFELISLFKYLRLSGKTALIFEFTTYATVPSMYIASFFFDVSAFYFNINANLNNPLQVIIMSLAAKRLRFCLIEPPSSLLAAHKWLHPLHLLPKVRTSFCGAQRELFIFTGYRPEQLASDCSACLSDIHSFSLEAHINYHLVGHDGIAMSEDEFEQVFHRPSVIVLLYASQSYQNRHSGIALEAICHRIPLVLRASDMSTHYIRRGFSVFPFTDYTNLNSALIAAIASEE